MCFLRARSLDHISILTGSVASYTKCLIQLIEQQFSLATKRMEFSQIFYFRRNDDILRLLLTELYYQRNEHMYLIAIRIQMFIFFELDKKTYPVIKNLENRPTSPKEPPIIRNA
jgi:hypothetical protein